ncbi:hypothetical protein DVH24_001547 [Malus domestica]|uniref:Pentatricopeptide repeat-containing protein n=1 Tax=Malus domestica TaxID=3750 RepID=A0A498K6K1_MALDO|nr:hypothetical protein DVH24_001547 [Malus domestica]
MLLLPHACSTTRPGEVFRLLNLMRISETKSDHITLGNVIGACANIASLEVGNQIRCLTVKSGIVLDVTVSNGLIDMYTKCGSIGSVQKLFGWMEDPDVVSWSSLTWFGYGEEALDIFKRMKELGIKPNEVTLVGVLTACSHIELVEEAWKVYKTMESEHGIVPTIEHCSCMVDLRARSGCLHEAEAFIKQMAFEPDVVVCMTLLAACRTRGNVEIGKRAAENILKLDPTHSAALVLLCNIHASSGSWDDVARLRNLMRERDVRKVPGQSWIEVKNRTHIACILRKPPFRSEGREAQSPPKGVVVSSVSSEPEEILRPLTMIGAAGEQGNSQTCSTR